MCGAVTLGTESILPVKQVVYEETVGADSRFVVSRLDRVVRRDRFDDGLTVWAERFVVVVRDGERHTARKALVCVKRASWFTL